MSAEDHFNAQLQAQTAQIAELREQVQGFMRQTRPEHRMRAPKLLLGKDCVPNLYDGKNKSKFPDWSDSVLMYVTSADPEFHHIEAMLKWALSLPGDDSIDEFVLDAKAKIEKWDGVDGLEHERISKQLYTFILSRLTDDAKNSVRSVERNNGIELWRVLSRENKPTTATIVLALFKSLFTMAAAKDLNSVTKVLYQFEEYIRQLHEHGESYKVHPLMAKAMLNALLPADAQTFLLMKVPADADYKTYKTALIEYINNFSKGVAPMIQNLSKSKKKEEREASGDYDWQWHEGGGQGAPEAEWPGGQEAEGEWGGDANGFAKGKGKSKGGKKGVFNGACHGCGEWGHSQRFCPKKGGKDKGGGKGKDKGGGKRNQGKGWQGQWPGKGMYSFDYGQGQGDYGAWADSAYAPGPQGILAMALTAEGMTSTGESTASTSPGRPGDFERAAPGSHPHRFTSCSTSSLIPKASLGSTSEGFGKDFACAAAVKRYTSTTSCSPRLAAIVRV